VRSVQCRGWGKWGRGGLVGRLFGVISFWVLGYWEFGRMGGEIYAG